MNKILPLKQDLPTDLTHEGKPLTYDSIHDEYAELGIELPKPRPEKQPTREHIKQARDLISDLLYPSQDGIMPELDDVSKRGFTQWQENKKWMNDKLNPILASLTSLVYEPHTSAILQCVDPMMVRQARAALAELYEPNEYLIDQEAELEEHRYGDTDTQSELADKRQEEIREMRLQSSDLMVSRKGEIYTGVYHTRKTVWR